MSERSPFENVGKRPRWEQDLIDLRIRILHRYFPTKPNRVRVLGACKFSWKLLAGHYGGGIEYGVRYQWLGLKISVGRCTYGRLVEQEVYDPVFSAVAARLTGAIIRWKKYKMKFQ